MAADRLSDASEQLRQEMNLDNIEPLGRALAAEKKLASERTRADRAERRANDYKSQLEHFIRNVKEDGFGLKEEVAKLKREKVRLEEETRSASRTIYELEERAMSFHEQLTEFEKAKSFLRNIKVQERIPYYGVVRFLPKFFEINRYAGSFNPCPRLGHVLNR